MPSERRQFAAQRRNFRELEARELDVNLASIFGSARLNQQEAMDHISPHACELIIPNLGRTVLNCQSEGFLTEDHGSILVSDLGVPVAALLVTREKPQPDVTRGRIGPIHEGIIEPDGRCKSPDRRVRIKSVDVCAIGISDVVGLVVRKVTECPCPREVFHGY